MRYVALLRGINVGGNRKVPMADLRALFEILGFQDVMTYINSGNVVFSSANRPHREAIESALLDRYGFAIDTLILTADEVRTIAEAIPAEWTNDRQIEKSDVIYLLGDANNSGTLDAMNRLAPSETLIYVDHAILANISREYQSRSSLLKIVGIPLYSQVTIRNVNTARKLAELVG
jgi:uncharacterized protein (DUF1697 family)